MVSPPAVLGDLEPDTLYTLTLATRLGNIYRQGEGKCLDGSGFSVVDPDPDPDPHHFGNLEPHPDPHLHQIKNPHPDPHQSDKLDPDTDPDQHQFADNKM